MSRFYVGIHEAHSDPCVAIVADGRVLACIEEERLLRFKHAHAIYPIRALEACLSHAGVTMDQVAAVAVNWDIAAYADGRMRVVFDRVNRRHPPDEKTLAWQKTVMNRYNPERIRAHHERQWRRAFGDLTFPPVLGYGHHRVHAFQAAHQSGFDESLVLTIDGSGDHQCSVVWHHQGGQLREIYSVELPHSLGWFYAAITEYLGFDAYDGEYKVMGLAAYGRSEPSLSEAMAQIVRPSDDNIGYEVDSTYLHHGLHSYSERFTDHLPELLGRPPRTPRAELDQWHKDLAFAAQATLEDAVLRMAVWGVRECGVRHICVSGGVGHNIKMNSRLLSDLPSVKAVFPHPLCSDAGGAAGAALLACSESEGHTPEHIRSVALGLEWADDEILDIVSTSGFIIVTPEHYSSYVANLLASGHVVGWFQGRMEAGPRALGQRSILADPRDVASRDRVNDAIKFREPWRPFCPSMKAEAASKYLSHYCDAPFMTIAFPATDVAQREIPAVVHIDGTARVQLVHRDINPQYHALLDAFESATGIPVLLNTSFNIRGEPIVCTPRDALRTFASTGMDALAIGPVVLEKRR